MVGGKIRINPLTPGRYDCSRKVVIFKLISRTDIFSIFHEIATRLIMQDLADD